MGITEIISIAVFALSVVSSVISILISKFKFKNEIDEYKSGTERSKEVISLIGEIIPKAIEYAEKTGGNGENKKLLALSKILIESFNNKIDYTSNVAVIEDTIEKLIAFSKEVNTVKVNKEV